MADRLARAANAGGDGMTTPKQTLADKLRSDVEIARKTSQYDRWRLLQLLNLPAMTNQVVFSRETEGASDLDACQSRRGSLCKCQPRCSVCGWGEHDAVHGPVFGHLPGSAPWGHKFVADAEVTP